MASRVEGLEPPAERRVRDDRVEPLGVLRQRLADLLQRRPRRHPDPAGHEALAVGELEVESRARPLGVLAGAAARVVMVELAGGVGLVRRLVGREADVAVDPEDRAPRVAHELGRDPGEPDVHLLDQRPERVPHLGLVDRAVAARTIRGVLCRARRRRNAKRGRDRSRGTPRRRVRRATRRHQSLLLGAGQPLDRDLPPERRPRSAAGSR